jgi:hypothetical protein
LDAAVIGLERAERDPALTQPKQIAPYLFLAQLIRRTAECAASRRTASM